MSVDQNDYRPLDAGRPTGTVTFLFTDLEGSTRMWEEHPGEMRRALARHDELIADVLQRRNGLRFSTGGDSFAIAFSRPADAVAAAVDIQLAFQAEPWLTTGPLRVRMGIHTGTAHERDGDYYGPTVNRAARIMSAAAGGQVLLSLATEELVRDNLPLSVTLRDLGEYLLRDISRPERVFQVLQPELPHEFPEIVGNDRPVSRVPATFTSFVGRERELAEVQNLLESSRLMTLTGVGGSGKTRMALQIAHELADSLPDGAWFVELGSIADPALVVGEVATTVGVREKPDRRIEDQLVQMLEPKTMLLVLDNCEHVVEAAARVATVILQACPKVRVLATSREPLQVAGEVAYRVPSLAVPNVEHLPALEELSAVESVRLFTERATAVQPSFRLTEANAQAVAQICDHLDGLPLAIELAAARVKAMSPAQIGERLNKRLRLLATTSRSVVPRQQTLEAAIEWSHDLLHDDERRLFNRLSVFVGSFSLEAAESVTGWGEIAPGDVLDLLVQLIDKSLVVPEETEEGAVRYRMLKTLSAYGAMKLAEEGESEQARERHAEHFVELAQEAAPYLEGPEQDRWRARLEADHDNFRAAINWAVEAGRAETALRLTGALAWFWYWRSYLTQGSQLLERSLDLDSGRRSEAYALAAYLAGVFANVLGEMDRARRRTQESIDIATDLGKPGIVARNLTARGVVARDRGELDEAMRVLRESESLGREANDAGLSLTLRFLGSVLGVRGEVADATAAFEESIHLHEQHGDRGGVARTRRSAAALALRLGRTDEALRQYLDCAETARDLGDRRGVGWALRGAAEAAIRTGEVDAAVNYLDESEAEFAELGDRRGRGWWGITSAKLASSLGDRETASKRLHEAAELLEAVGDGRGLAWTKLQSGELAGDRNAQREALRQFVACTDVWGTAAALEALGRSALDGDHMEVGVQLLAGASRMRSERDGTEHSPAGLSIGGAAPGEVDSWWRAGWDLSDAQLVELALQNS